MPDLTEQRVLKCAIDALNDYAALVGDDHEVGTCNCDLVNTANGLSALLAAAEGVERDAALVLANARTHLPTEVKTTALGTMTKKECAIFDEGFNAALQRARNLLDMPAEAIRKAMERRHD